LVVAHELPPAPAGKDYQMWIVPKGEGAAPIPAGLLQRDGTVMEVEVALPAGVEASAAALAAPGVALRHPRHGDFCPGSIFGFPLAPSPGLAIAP
jgi:hypothetical protein